MTLWQYLLTCLLVIGPTVVASIQFVDKESFGKGDLGKALAAIIIEDRLWITLIASILTALLGILSTILFRPYLVQRKFRESLMDGIFEQVLDNDRNQARITLFKDVGFFRRWWYRFKDFVGLLRSSWPKVDVNEFLRICNYCRYAHYIQISGRWGNHHKNSKTYFYVNKQTSDSCQGVAGQVRQREEMIVISLPRIDGLDLEKAGKDHPDVSEFMKRGYISSFKHLKSINKLAPHIYGNIISARAGKKKIVFVIVDIR